jgi:hypothetical protein
VTRASRRAVLGLVSGLVVAGALPHAVGGLGPALILGPLFGTLLALGFPPGRSAAVDAAMTGAALGVCAWALVPVAGYGWAGWDAGVLRALFPRLAGWVLFGGAIGLAVQGVAWIGDRISWTRDSRRTMPAAAGRRARPLRRSGSWCSGWV